MKIENCNHPHKRVQFTQEGIRLADAPNVASWRKWGPYLSERQWGTVREDYSADGDAWNYLSHDHARSRAYRWGEDGIGGFSDDQQKLCLSVALWNGRDSILKERLFGLTNEEGNHGEDVKELHFYVDGIPTHSYMRMLYKYPHAAFPYDNLIAVNADRSLNEPEYEILDTGLFDEGRYFDISIEFAKAASNDILMRITAYNRGPEACLLDILPQIWARNTWSWSSGNEKPVLSTDRDGQIKVRHPEFPPMRLLSDGLPNLLFCENETNTERVFGQPCSGYFKDGINDFVVEGNHSAVNPKQIGTKAALHYTIDIPAGGSAVVRVRLRPDDVMAFPADFDEIVQRRRGEADEFYSALQTEITEADRRLVQRQAFAGMLWGKQYYGYDVNCWLRGDPTMPNPPNERQQGRNSDWDHLNFSNVISVPDKWEYPWFATWDLAFHCITFALIDPAFAKSQLVLLTQASSQHPNGQMPAYEWNFKSTGPPVHAFAALQIYEVDKRLSGVGDEVFLARVFHKLMLDFTWWVNQQDAEGRNVFQGGSLGLDNITLFDRGEAMEDGSYVNQADATAWMAMYALNLMRIAIELAMHDHVYEDLATKFFEHFLYIANAAHAMGADDQTGLWDDQDGFYYDVLRTPGEPDKRLRVRSLVGLIPLLAVEVLHDDYINKLPQFRERLQWFLDHRPDLEKLVSCWGDKGDRKYRLLSLMRRSRMNCVLKRLLDEAEFLSAQGIRSLSRYHLLHPFTLKQNGKSCTIGYEPADGETGLIGGNSNWRGPIWMPLNFLIIDALRKFYIYYGDDHRVAFPTGSTQLKTLSEIADALTGRVTNLFLKNSCGRRVFLGKNDSGQTEELFQDLILFHEYFNGDTGEGLGASHQTGWTGLIAVLLHPRSELA